MLPEGKKVLVTGGNGGIGTHLVSRLVEQGAHVNGAADFLAVDLSKAESVLALGESLRSTPPDILVSLAGLNAFGEFESMPRTRLDTLMQVNLLAPMQLVHSLLPAMLARGSGHIVNIGSALGGIAR